MPNPTIAMKNDTTSPPHQTDIMMCCNLTNSHNNREHLSYWLKTSFKVLSYSGIDFLFSKIQTKKQNVVFADNNSN